MTTKMLEHLKNGLSLQHHPISPQSITKLSCFSIHIHPGVSSSKPSQTNNEDTIISTICNSLHKGVNWETLTQASNSIIFTNSIVQSILLHLKEPINAKKALNFFHWSAQEKNFQHSISTYCITIHVLAKARLVKDAKALLESALTKLVESNGNVSIFVILDVLLDSYRTTDSTPFVFDLFIQTCMKLRLIDDVLEACEILDENGFMLSVITYNTMLYFMQKSEKTCLVWGVYGHMIEKRKYPNENTIKIMVDALRKEGKLRRFLDVVDRIVGKRCSLPSVIVNTCLVYRMIEENRVGDALVLLKKILQKNMILDVIAYTLVVFAKVKMGDLEAAWEVFEGMLNRGFDGNAFVYTLFIGAYCEEGKIEEAIEVLTEMENSGFKPFDETFNHLIKGCCRAAALEESLKFCDRMSAMGFIPSCSVFNEMVGKLSENGYTKHADEILTVLLERGFVPDENTYSYVISGYGKEDHLEDALKIYYEMEHKSISPNSLALNSLVISLCQHKKLSEAEKFLKIMKDRSLVPDAFVYQTLISCYVEKGDQARVHELYNEMLGD